MTTTAGDVRQWCSRKLCYVPNPCCGRISCLHEDYCEVYEMEHERLESIDAFNPVHVQSDGKNDVV